MISHLNPRRKSSRGIALIFVLALIVILTTFVLVILSRATLNRQISFSSVGQQRADQIAQGSFPLLLNDLRQEIAAGSLAVPTSAYASTNVYIPSSNQTIVPAFAGYSPTVTTDPFPNLLKRSAVSTPFFPKSNATLYNYTQYAPSDRASAVNSSGDPSIDGRYINATRWNKPLLMDPTKLGASPLNSAAVYGSFIPPDWTLVTRAGPQVFTSWNASLKDPANATNFVVGRYAYMIYDEGGLLDINEAGYTSTFATDFDKSSKRGRLAQADLTALPSLSQSDIDKIVSWRNATSSSTTPSYFDFLFHGSFSSGAFQYNQSDPASAFRTVINGDQTFTNRQDLISFFNFTFGNSSTQSAALAFLGTFSRERNIPTYCPPNPVGTNSNTLSGTTVPSQFMYANNAEVTTSVNRNFPTVRIANSGTLPDGTVLTAGDPLIRRRFPLSRLQLVENKADNPTDTSHDADIKRYFGLVYSQASGKWTYTSPDSNAVATSIKTLGQVSQLSNPREADFFELLQAGILNGSLGKTAGRDFNTTTNPLGNSTSGSETVTYDSRTDFQVIQIGANIIDQYDADNIPTTITYGGTPTSAQGPDFFDFYGIENMPYISKICNTIYRLEKPGIDPATGLGNPHDSNNPFQRPFVASWFQFELWNLHQNPQSGSNLPLRIYATGNAGVVVFSSNNNYGGTDFTQWAGNPVPNKPAAAYGTKTFTNAESIGIPISVYTKVDYFREPALLTPDLGITVSDPADHLQESNYYSTPNSWNFIGLKSAEAFASDMKARENNTNSPYTVLYGEALNPFEAGITSDVTQGPITFFLQCESPAGSGNWRTVQRIKSCVVACDTSNLPSSFSKDLQYDHEWMVPSISQIASQAGSNYEPNYIGQTTPTLRMLPDPRTDRFGAFEAIRDEPSNSVNSGPTFNQTALPSILGNKTRGLFGGYFASDRERVPTNATALTGYYGGGVSYAPNGWFDERTKLSAFDASPPGAWAGLLMLNKLSIPAGITSGVTSFLFENYCYADPDSIVRGGDAYYANGSDQDANGFTDAFSAQMGSSGTVRPERPLILNRPFRSVGELGYVHRGQPWKSLDFFTPDSADAGLLDIFSIDENSIVAGTVDLNTRQKPVLQAILQGAAKSEMASSTTDPGDPVLSSSDAANLANLMVSSRFGTTSSSGPLGNRSELVTRFMAQNTGSTAYTVFPINKPRREAVVRPLAAIGNTRTWNLLIDVIAQSGRYPVNATGLSQFAIEGEKRYWWHLAIDRFTGQVIDSQLEPVYE